MLVAHDAELLDRARYLATQARDPVVHYEHRAVGHNYRMSNLLAAIGRGQLSTLGSRVEARRANYRFYQEHLDAVDGVELMPLAPYGEPTCWLTCILVEPDRVGATPEDVRLALAAVGIEARPTWKPMHLQPVYRHLPVRGGAVAADLYARGLCLPSGSTLTADDRQRVVDAVLDALPVAGGAGLAAASSMGRPR
jgi:dTDP-4-amino-4,6-dideoxygalactose transaminase